MRVGRPYLTGKSAVNIFRELESAIRSGRIQPGARLPSVRELAVDLAVNKNTVAAAYRMLQDAGLTLAAGRRGTVIAPLVTYATPVRDLVPPGVLSVADGNPDPAFLPTPREWVEAVRVTMTSPRLYGEARNFDGLVAWARGIFAADGVEPAEIAVTAGALDAVERLLRTQARTGDPIGVEDPGYMTILNLVRALGLRAVPLRVDDEGLVPSDLESALRRRIRAVVFSTRAQNPTGAVTTPGRARALAALAARAEPDVLFIDDDHSSLFRFAEYRPWHVGPSRRWSIVRSVSKFLGPDLRLAVVSGDATTIRRLDQHQSVGMGWQSQTLQRVAAHFLTSPVIRPRIAAAGRAYAQRQTVLLRELRKRGIAAQGRAGLNVWIPVADEARTAQWLLARGWAVRAGAEFRATSSPAIRVTTARLTAEQCDRLAARLEEFLTDAGVTFSG